MLTAVRSSAARYAAVVAAEAPLDVARLVETGLAGAAVERISLREAAAPSAPAG